MTAPIYSKRPVAPKMCPACGLMKTTRDFGPSKYRADQLQRQCRTCRADTARRSRQRPAPPLHTTCEICHQVDVTGRRLSLDHDHQTGDFRGWLCSRCNQGLGLFRDSPKKLKSAAAYLVSSRASKGGYTASTRGAARVVTGSPPTAVAPLGGPGNDY